MTISNIRREMAYVCSLMALVMLSVSLFMFKDLRLGEFGLIHDFPPLYFVAIFFSLLSGFLTIGIRQERTFLQSFNCLFLLIALWLVPILLEGTPRFASAYKTIGFVEYVYREGRLEPASWELFYHNWPGFSVFASVLWMITGVDEIYPIVLYYPFVLHLLMFTLLLWMFKKLTFEINIPNGWYLGGVVYLLANFVNQDYFSPQSFAYYLLTFIIILLIDRKQWLKSHKRAVGFKLMLILTFTALAVSHILSSLVALTLFAVFSLFERKTFFTLTLFSFVVLVAWTIYGAVVYFDAHLSNIFMETFELEKSWNQNISNRVRGSSEHVLVNKFRILYAIYFELYGFIGLMLSIRKKNHLIMMDLVKISIVSVCMAGSFVYGGESLMRGYLFMLVPLSFFCMGFLYQKMLLPLLFMFCALALPLHIITHYGNEQVDYVNLGIIRGTDFLSDHSFGGYVLGYETILGNTKHTEKFVSLTWEQYFSKRFTQNMDDKDYYMGVGPWERTFWSMFYDNPAYIENVDLRLRENRNCVLFYSNGEINLYYVKPEKELSDISVRLKDSLGEGEWEWE